MARRAAASDAASETTDKSEIEKGRERLKAATRAVLRKPSTANLAELSEAATAYQVGVLSAEYGVLPGSPVIKLADAA